MSFSYKIGIPGHISRPRYLYILDLRKVIRNPWSDPVLRKLNGLDLAVQEYIRVCPKSLKVVTQWIIYADCYNWDIAVGCSGGQHRSVAVVEMIMAGVKLLNPEKQFNVVHRDLVIK